MYFRDKDIAKFLGLYPSSITNVRKNKQRMYALYRIGYEDVLQNPSDTSWENVKNRAVSEYLGMCPQSLSAMKRNQPKKYELLKRGFMKMSD